EAAKTLMKQLTKGWSAQYSLVKIEEDDVDGLLPHITRDQIDELIIVNEKFTVENLITLRNRCLEQHVGFGFLPRALTALQGADYTIHEELGIPVIEVKPTPLDGWGRIAKRTFDIVVSTLLIIIASPFYLLIGLVMFLTSGSPLVIRHKRIGRGGLPIVISKYRSMKRDWTDQNGKLSAKFQEYLSQHPDAAQEWKETAKLKDDPRISAIGKLLRATRLDELPQFFDVLRGDLSLVGPRPIIDWELEKFGEKARILFHVRPGITGPWQVAGGNKLPYDERVRLNAHYIENWSLGLDMVILTKTAWLVVAGILGRLIGRGESEEAY
ncbi:MAG TPA: sugar transferase, partial [Verrucomicrobiae bacterium]|nr:sugar transferase [Verrucomicrobiae bacterium]